MRDAVLVERAPERRAVGDVALDERDPRALLLGQHEPEPRVVRAEVEPDRLLAEVDECLQRPGAEAAESAGDEQCARRQPSGASW